MPSSLSEQIIPLLISPLILASFILKLPGRTESTGEKAILIPLLTLFAPQITGNVLTPSNTLQIFNLSAFGCFLIACISPTIISFNSSKFVDISASRPSIVSVSATSSIVKLISKKSFIHE